MRSTVNREVLTGNANHQQIMYNTKCSCINYYCKRSNYKCLASKVKGLSLAQTLLSTLCNLSIDKRTISLY